MLKVAFFDIFSLLITQPFVLISDCVAKADLIILVDTSSSINSGAGAGGNFDLVREFIINLVLATPVGSDQIRIGAFRFADNANLEFYLNACRDQNCVVDRIRRIQYRGGETNTAEGLELVRTDGYQERNGHRPSVKKLLIVITDGVSNINEENTIPNANLLKRDDVGIIAVGVSQHVDFDELRGIASSPELVLQVDSFDALEATKDRLIELTCRAVVIPPIIVEPPPPIAPTPPPGPTIGEFKFTDLCLKMYHKTTRLNPFLLKFTMDLLEPIR